MSDNSFNALVDGLTLTLGKGQVGHYKGRGSVYNTNSRELLRDIEKIANLIREKQDNLVSGKSKQAVANARRLEEYPKLLDGLLRKVKPEDTPAVEAILAKAFGPKRGRTVVAAAAAAGGPGRSMSRGRSASPAPAAAAAAPKSKAPSAWNEHVKAYAASHGIPYAQALRNARSTYVPPEKVAAAASAPRARSPSVSRRGSGAAAAAAANPFNQFNNVKPKAKATRKAKAKAAPAAPYNPFNNNALYANSSAAAAATNPFNMFNNVPAAAAAAAPKNKTKRTRAKGAWNAHVANVQAANPGMKRANVLKLASKQMGIRKNSPLSEYGALGLNNSNNNNA
jgi:hypothetical protein